MFLTFFFFFAIQILNYIYTIKFKCQMSSKCYFHCAVLQLRLKYIDVFMIEVDIQ